MRRKYHKYFGPGGIDCPCCNPWRVHPRKMKKLVKRINRRNDKVTLNKEY